MTMHTENEGQLLARIAELETENVRLLTLEKSVLHKAEMLRNNFWDVSEEVGAAGEIHAAITGLHVEFEKLSDAFQELRRKALGEGPTLLLDA